MPTPKKKTAPKKPKAAAAPAPETEAAAAPAPEAEVETEVAAAPEAETTSRARKGKATKAHCRRVKHGPVVRTYSFEDHGEGFEALAEEFAGHQGLIVELE